MTKVYTLDYDYCAYVSGVDEEITLEYGDKVVRLSDYEALQLELDELKECEQCGGQLPGTGLCVKCWTELVRTLKAAQERIAELTDIGVGDIG